ncbi:hypothetical protein E2562_010937 [Oryza meyeriana var. granulata]|uniref:RING-type domain-containing protein n=1 Tax=Oryza meyeriana var. granulata TaxID=110450 RepID=A0A6G1BUR8_9ORYZ|nr:hypothetical protein E2562_010937 [Oryza meyeriana var. granulata]
MWTPPAWWMMRMWTAAGWRKLGMCMAPGWEKLQEWWRLQTWALGGVRTLDQALRPRCKVCGKRMEAGAVVRTLSCEHFFHKACIDGRLRENGMVCPVCRRAARWVLPWKAPPEGMIDPHRGHVRTLDHPLNYPCTICQEMMEAGSEVRTLSCGHDYHTACNIEKWLRENNRTCPLCRQTDRRGRGPR